MTEWEKKAIDMLSPTLFLFRNFQLKKYTIAVVSRGGRGSRGSRGGRIQ